MMNRLHKIARACKSFTHKEDGASTIEFMLVLPAAMFFFATTYESGVVGLRNVMLERAVDVTVRDVRIGAIPNPTHDGLKAAICDVAGIIPSCLDRLKLEMVRKDPRAWTPLDASADCADQSDSATPVVNFVTGGNNDLMVLRACALFDPILPTSALGAALQEGSGLYALVATSSYVVEPFN